MSYISLKVDKTKYFQNILVTSNCGWMDRENNIIHVHLIFQVGCV